jgi:phosphoribosylamine--glycine ligase
MKILVIGSGGREHAVVDALAQNSKVQQIFVAPGNGGTAGQATNIPIAADNVAALRDFARDEKIDLTFVGPEVPLSLGVVDLFRNGGMKIVGPNAENAQLESSKTYSKTSSRPMGSQPPISGHAGRQLRHMPVWTWCSIRRSSKPMASPQGKVS